MSSSDRATSEGGVTMWNPIVSGEGRTLGSSEGWWRNVLSSDCERPRSLRGRHRLTDKAPIHPRPLGPLVLQITPHRTPMRALHFTPPIWHQRRLSDFPSFQSAVHLRGWSPRFAQEAQPSPIPGARYQRHDAIPRRPPEHAPPPTNMPAPEPTPSSPGAATHRSRARPP